jgi:hypothetical protein
VKVDRISGVSVNAGVGSDVSVYAGKGSWVSADEEAESLLEVGAVEDEILWAATFLIGRS